VAPESGILTGAQCVRLFHYAMAAGIAQFQLDKCYNLGSKLTVNKLFLNFDATISFTDGTRKVCAFRYFAKGAGRDVYESSDVPFIAKIVPTFWKEKPNQSEYNIHMAWAHRCPNLIPRILFHLPSVRIQGIPEELDILIMEKAGMTFKQYVQQVIGDEQACRIQQWQAKYDICRRVIGVFNLWAQLPIELQWEKDAHQDNIALSSSGAAWWWIDFANAEAGDQRLHQKFVWAFFGGRVGKNCFSKSLCCISQNRILC
jgi:hypothetical protein